MRRVIYLLLLLLLIESVQGIDQYPMNFIVPGVVSSNVTLNATNNYTSTINGSATVGADVELQASENATVNITITKSTNATIINATNIDSEFYAMGQNQKSLSKYLEVNATVVGNLTQVTLTSYYSIADLDKNGDGDADDPGDINEHTLKLYWFCANCSGQKWFPINEGNGLVPKGGPEVFDVTQNFTQKYIRVTMNHFSTFAIAGTVSAAGVPSGGGTGGGSGGSGVVTSEPYANIEKAERYDKSLIANTPVIYTFKTPELSIYEIAVTGKESENDIAVRVEALKGTSKLVKEPAPGIVYRNVNVWSGTKRIKEVLIRFKVENSWLSSNSLAGSEVRMVQWRESKIWIQLDTSEKNRDDKFTYYEAKTNTLSEFAIVGLKGEVMPTETAVEVTETPVPEETTPTATPTVKVPGFEIALAMAAISALYVLRKVIL